MARKTVFKANQDAFALCEGGGLRAGDVTPVTFLRVHADDPEYATATDENGNKRDFLRSRLFKTRKEAHQEIEKLILQEIKDAQEALAENQKALEAADTPRFRHALIEGLLLKVDEGLGNDGEDEFLVQHETCPNIRFWSPVDDLLEAK